MLTQSPKYFLCFFQQINVFKTFFYLPLFLTPLIIFELPVKANFEDCYNGTIYRDNHTYVKLVCQCVTSIRVNRIFSDLADRMRYCVNENFSYSNNSRQLPMQQPMPIFIEHSISPQDRNQQLMIDAMRSFRPGRAVN